ncbi:hypothetical protein K7432_013550 [Basidiobolus ranarum]|uniref:ABC transmembrane type-1 domain-containing protein n=1 Tax=Basidiobolus ranarum TaxID=34480 RepID=A0ABR2WJ26_9FUNG
MSNEEFIEGVSNHNNPDIVAISVNNEKALSLSIDEIDNDKKQDTKKGKKKKDPKEIGPKVSYFKLYRFANSWDATCIILGTICAIACGVGQPLVGQLMGNVINGLTGEVNPDKVKEQVIALGTICAIACGVGQPFVARLMGDVINSIQGEFNPDTVKEQVAALREIVIKFTIIGAIILIAAYGQMCFFTLSTENQTKRIREKYLHASMRQDIAWHDIGKKSESLNSRLNSDTQLIFDGMSDKVGMCIMSLSTFVTGFVIAFMAGWKMSLVL